MPQENITIEQPTPSGPSLAFRNIWTVMKRELLAYFYSPVAYVFIIIFLLLIGFFTFMVGQFFEIGEASLDRPFFSWHPWLWLILAPAIGMRLWAEEQRMGNIELLLTMPLEPWHAIVGKFLASWTVLGISLVLTFPIVLTVSFLGAPDFGTILCGYLGSFLLAGAFLGVTSATSAMTRNQVISFIVAIVLCLFLILAGFEPVTRFVQQIFPDSSRLIDFVAGFGVITHFESFQRGVIDLRDVFYFLSLIGFTLFVTSVVLRARRA
jgi:ABC-2 type transport system permease protein